MEPLDKTQDLPRFILIDGNAILHRAFHALPPLTNPKGEMVNAVYGFFTMFFKILEDIKPAYIAVCFDRKAPTFRKQLYVGYQAKRPKMSDDLSPQVEIIHKILLKMEISIFELDGYEADDLIGTLASQAIRLQTTDYSKKKKKKTAVDRRQSTVDNIEVIIVSGDRDLLQLVNSHVKMLAPLVGLTNTILYDSEMVEKKFGIKPSQFIDYKALVGDSSDNYPGVAGIGPKTASELLRTYGSFEKLYENLGELPPKISERLATDAEQAALAKKLATIACDAPATLNLAKCSLAHFSAKKAQEAFEDLGSKSLVKRLSSYREKVEKVGKVEKEKSKDGQLGLL